MRNVFREKSYTKYGGETSPRPFSEKLKLTHLWINTLKSFIRFVFILCKVEGYQNILKLSCRTPAFNSY